MDPTRLNSLLVSMDGKRITCLLEAMVLTRNVFANSHGWNEDKVFASSHGLNEDKVFASSHGWNEERVW